MLVRGRTALNAVVSRVQSVLVDIGLDDRVGLDVHGIASTIGLDTEGQVGVWVNIPVQSTKKPKSSVSVPKRSVSCSITTLSIPTPAIGHRPKIHTCPLHPPVVRKFCRNTPMESRMTRCVRGRVFRYIVQARCAESSDGTVGHCLASRDRRLIFEIKHRIRLHRSMKAFGVPSCIMDQQC